MFAVAGVSGRTGAATADALLKQGEKVRVMVRKPEQGEAWLAKRCEVAIVDFDQPETLTAATKGLTGAFLMLPPIQGDDPVAAQGAMLTKMVGAIKRSGMKTLVFLSSIGAQHPAGTGPIVALNRAEKALNGLFPSVTFLRAAYFLENWIPSFMPALETSELPFFGHTHLKFMQVCTHDIGVAAAQLLAENAHGTRFVELAGKENWSVEDVAAVLTSLLGQPIKAVDRHVETAKDSLEKMGMAPAMAALYADMYQGMARGHVSFAHPHQVMRGQTSLFDSLKPMV
jgi:uncharacterized protein YbjT (DUF2867 family)